MSTVLITGGTGLVGQALSSKLLEKKYDVIILTRKKEKYQSTSRLSYAEWDTEKGELDEEAFAKADHIIHLAGAGVADKRWTTERKKIILKSRVTSSQLITESLQKIPNKIKTVISASAIGWYGADKTGIPFTENDPPANDFLGHTCWEWEESIDPAAGENVRLVKLRTGIVLSVKGGALKEFIKPLKFGIASILGNGKQILSWIHIDDLINLYIYMMENMALKGVYNAVAPHPVSNKELILSLAKKRNRFYIPVPVPAFILKGVLGEMSTEILKSTTVSAEKVLENGFSFQYPEIDTALSHLTGE